MNKTFSFPGTCLDSNSPQHRMDGKRRARIKESILTHAQANPKKPPRPFMRSALGVVLVLLCAIAAYPAFISEANNHIVRSDLEMFGTDYASLDPVYIGPHTLRSGYFWDGKNAVPPSSPAP
jgi:hypothetical protein